jgi:hypothetical protein
MQRRDYGNKIATSLIKPSNFVSYSRDKQDTLKISGSFLIRAYFKCIAAKLRHTSIHHAMAKSLQRSFYKKEVLAAIKRFLVRLLVITMAYPLGKRGITVKAHAFLICSE